MNQPFRLSLLAAAMASICFGSRNARAGDVDQPAPPPAVATTLEPLIVTTSRLRDARIDLSPKVGTTVYTLDRKQIDALGQGDAAAFDEVLLRLPGVSKDSKASGSIHVRDDHGNIQYRIDGVQLPENISGFGQSIDTRFVEQMDFLTGALPAQYGLRSAGVVEIQTKEGALKPGGRIGIEFGSHDSVQPSLELFGTSGALNYYLSGSYLSNSAGIENPQATQNPLHDKTRQAKSFGDLSYYVNDDTRIGMLFGTYNGRFQIPNNPGQVPTYSLTGVSNTASGFNALPSSQLDERQREVNRYFVVSLQKSIGKFDFLLSAFHQYSDLHFTPDPAGDLIYTGVASDTRRSNAANGLQWDGSYKWSADHTIRFGTALTRQTTHSDNTVAVFPVDASGSQTATDPIRIVDNSMKTGQLASVYLQDEWHLSPALTVNYGGRFDRVSAFIHEQQFSPRINMLYKVSEATAFHAGYSRYFTPPPQELASQQSIDRYAGTSNQAEIAQSDNVKAERTHYYDIGFSHKLSPTLTVSVDAYYKKIANLIDEGQFGAALILSPFNYAQGYAQGLELSAIYSNGPWSAYLNGSYQKAQGKHIISGQSLFAPGELAYIASHNIYLDHDQTYTASGGFGYKFGDSKLSGDALFGSGVRRTLEGGTPNGATMPRYAVANLGISHNWSKTVAGDIEARLAVLNVFDKTYMLRDGTGVGVGAPQYGARRTFFMAISTSF
jgi:outer membrane receptor protein involved in Fe transport